MDFSKCTLFNVGVLFVELSVLKVNLGESILGGIEPSITSSSVCNSVCFDVDLLNL